MKTLLLLRHAKSSWDDASLSDFDRPLNERGNRTAPVMGSWLRKKKLKPDLVLSSPAVRARQTTQIVCEAAGWAGPVQYDERVYEAPVQRLLSIVSQIENEVNLTMMVGHNPGLEELVEALTGESCRMPTGAVALIELNVEQWQEVRRALGKLKWLIRPRDIMS